MVAADSSASMPESNVDVLIIGAGPAGLMTMARQADGLNCRSLEIFESLGFIESIEKEGSRMSEIQFWNPDAETGHLKRTGRIPDTIPGLSRYQQTILHQGRVEAHLAEDAFKHSDGKIIAERGVLPESLEVDRSLVSDPAAYPIKVVLRHLSEEESNPNGLTHHGETRSGLFRSSLVSAAEEEALYKKGDKPAQLETVRAKFVIGCDGAHSWTRRTLGIKMLGEQTDYVWGVLDAVPVTNFPDIRSRCAIHSANAGSVMVIPQERDLVRLYIQLPVKVKPGEYLDRSKVTPQTILESARAILHPYTLETERIEWFTGYHIGQRLTESFSPDNRVFLAGDACHTHSPKAGQGMNTSMQDTFNLAWKLDTKFSKLFSGKPAQKDDLEGIDLKEFKDVFAQGNYFAAGMSIDYADSSLVAKDGQKSAVKSRQELASKLPVGQRFFGAQVVNVASATADFLTTRMLTNGAFRMLVFAGKVAEKEQMARLQRLADYLDSSNSVVSKYTPRDRHRASVIDVITIHASDRYDVELFEFPAPSIWPAHDPHLAYKKVYVDGPSHHRGHGHAYEAYGIDPDQGAIVIVRPDQYVAMVTSMDDFEGLDAYFAQFLVPAKQGSPASDLTWPKQPDWSKVATQTVNKSWAVDETESQQAKHQVNGVNGNSNGVPVQPQAVLV
ncbi:hypothetical protein OIV83_005721 [Microbotryomycetes sp. JL201]|nr:hypothetical protein OIV83_005721 [Microbotryomycetes sp. JL201]